VNYSQQSLPPRLTSRPLLVLLRLTRRFPIGARGRQCSRSFGPIRKCHIWAHISLPHRGQSTLTQYVHISSVARSVFVFALYRNMSTSRPFHAGFCLFASADTYGILLGMKGACLLWCTCCDGTRGKGSPSVVHHTNNLCTLHNRPIVMMTVGTTQLNCNIQELQLF